MAFLNGGTRPGRGYSGGWVTAEGVLTGLERRSVRIMTGPGR